MARRVVLWPLVLVTVIVLGVLQYVPEAPWWGYGVSILGLLCIWTMALWTLRSHRAATSQGRGAGEDAGGEGVSAERATLGRQPAAPNALRRTISKHPLLSYFTIAYAIKWILLIPYTLAAWGIISGDWGAAFILATFGPFVAGVLVVDVTQGRRGLSRMRDSIRQWKVGRRWLLFILAGIPAAIMLGVLVQPGAFVGFEGLTPTLLLTYPLTYVLVWFGGGGLNEEVGWRGFALPFMQPRYGPLWGTLALGVAHCFWHGEEFLTPAQGGGPGTGWTPFLVNLPTFLVLVLSFSIIMTWIYNKTRGSLFAAISAHASVDIPQAALLPLFPAVGATSTILGSTAALGVIAIIVLVVTRGRLGYRPAPHPAG